MSTLGKNIIVYFVILVILTQGQSRTLDVRQINDEDEVCKPECPNNKVYCTNPDCYPGEEILKLVMKSQIKFPSSYRGIYDTTPTIETRSRRSVDEGDRCTNYKMVLPRVATGKDKQKRFVVNTPLAVQQVEVGTCSSTCQHSNCSQLFQEIQLSTTSKEGDIIESDTFKFPSKCLCV